MTFREFREYSRKVFHLPALLEIVFTLKDNQPCLMEEARRAALGREPDRAIRPRENQTVALLDAKEVWWDAAKQSVRVVR